LLATIQVTPAASPTAADNDYTRLAAVVGAATAGDTIHLRGTFDWTEAHSAAAWAKGNDGLPGTPDDYSIQVPANKNNVTLTAARLGDFAAPTQTIDSWLPRRHNASSLSEVVDLFR